MDGSGTQDTADPSAYAGPQFASTHWSVVLAANGTQTSASLQAWDQLARIYWRPLYAHIRRRGASHHDAQDRLQSFLATLLANGALQKADPSRGRFRSFLLAALDNHLANAHRQATALKRGGGTLSVPWPDDADTLACAMAAVAPASAPPERLFDRDWAHTLLDCALSGLEQEFHADSKSLQWRVLRPFLFAGPAPGAYAAAAAELNVHPDVLPNAVLRLRQRLRARVRSEIAHTVATIRDIDDELRYLVEVLIHS